LAGAECVFWLVPPDPRAASVEAGYVDFARPACTALQRHGVKRVGGVSALGRGLSSKAGYVTASLAMDDLIASTGVAYRALAMPSFMDNLLRQVDAIVAAHPGMHGIALDVADPRAIDAFAGRVREQFPTLNVLFNNAGISRQEDLATDTLAVARSIIETNIVSVLHLTTALLTLLKEQPHATVLATTSGLAFMPRASYPTYCASKAFLHSWLQSLRRQLCDTSVEVLELIPPYVQTELIGPAQATDPRAVPLAKYIADVMPRLGASANEILVEEARELRWAEKTGIYGALFAARNARSDGPDRG